MASFFPFKSSLHCSIGLVAAPSVVLAKLLLVPLVVRLSIVVAVLAVSAVVVFSAVVVNVVLVDVVYVVVTVVVVLFSPSCHLGNCFFRWHFLFR
jgi:hypothetical protein